MVQEVVLEGLEEREREEEGGDSVKEKKKKTHTEDKK